MMIYLLRHGEIETDGQWRYVGQSDIPLTSKGEAQARYWRKTFAGIPFDRIYASDLGRTRRSAEIIAKGRQLEVRMEPDLREIQLGLWDGLTRSEVASRFPGEFEKRGTDLPNLRPKNGESFSDLSRRVVPVFERIAGERVNMILIVAHAGVNRVILCHVLGMPLANLMRLEQGYSALNIVKNGKQGFRVVAMNRLPDVD
jgi:alpha-ribazole phosphatase